MIAVGGNEITKAYIGGTEIDKIYLGEDLVFSNIPEVLPYDAQIEYLESNGTQYIDTGVYISGQTVELRMKYSGFTNKYFCCGCRTNYNNTAFVFSNGGNTNARYDQYFLNYGNAYRSITQCPNDGNIHNVVMTNAVVVDNTTIVSFSKTNFTTTRTMWLFGSNNQDALKYGSMRIYECKIYQNNALVIDLIPVRVGTTGYMYDKVSKELFENKGSGNFVLGNDIT